MRLSTVRVFLVLALASVAASAQAQKVAAVVPGVHVVVEPPALRVEERPAAPSPNHVWIAGHWAWRAGHHVWLGGHYALPPGPGYVWEPARWEREGKGWTFFEGHWHVTAVAAPTEVYEPAPMGEPAWATEAPPEPLVENQPAAPFPGAVWISGYWAWHGSHYQWVGGRWSAPRPGRVWISQRWINDHGRYRMEPGHWR